jgi:hypothetical protein
MLNLKHFLNHERFLFIRERSCRHNESLEGPEPSTACSCDFVDHFRSCTADIHHEIAVDLGTHRAVPSTVDSLQTADDHSIGRFHEDGYFDRNSPMKLMIQIDSSVAVDSCFDFDS